MAISLAEFSDCMWEQLIALGQRRYGLTRNEAEDALQNTFVALSAFFATHPGHVTSVPHATAIVHQTFRWKCIEQIRQRHGGKPLPEDLPAKKSKPDKPPNLDPLFVRAGLSERERSVMHLLLAGNSSSEVAERLGIPVKQVHLDKFRALAKLRKLWEEDPDFFGKFDPYDE